MGVSFTELAAVIAILWLVIGLVMAVAMGRRGHNAFGWFVIGALLGPISIPLAVSSVARGPRRAPRTLSPGEAGKGPVSVLVGIDGSPESSAAVTKVVELFGDRLERITLAAVVDIEAADRGTGEGRRAAEAALESSAGMAGLRPGTVVLSGRPSEELERHAREGDFDLLVVGRRGRGMTKALLGSVASDLAKRAGVPVLLVPQDS
jgi:nucleotide-binding universal stress UspA family protein